jgi:hypothetical protein
MLYFIWYNTIWRDMMNSFFPLKLNRRSLNRLGRIWPISLAFLHSLNSQNCFDDYICSKLKSLMIFEKCVNHSTWCFEAKGIIGEHWRSLGTQCIKSLWADSARADLAKWSNFEESIIGEITIRPVCMKSVSMALTKLIGKKKWRADQS